MEKNTVSTHSQKKRNHGDSITPICLITENKMEKESKCSHAESCGGPGWWWEELRKARRKPGGVGVLIRWAVVVSQVVHHNLNCAF